MCVLGPIELVVLQGTPFCDLNCSYCYLSAVQVWTGVRVAELASRLGLGGWVEKKIA